MWTLAVGDGHRFDEEVRHVLLRRRRPPRPCSCPSSRSTLRRQVDAVRRPQEQQHRAADAVGVDLQLDLLAGRVLALVGDELEVVEAELAAVEAFADDREEVAAFDRVLRLCRSPCTTGDTGPARRPSSAVGLAFGVGVEVPVADFGFDRLAFVLVVGDLEQPSACPCLRPACCRGVWAAKLALIVSPTR